jgi:hypothetical protein
MSKQKTVPACPMLDMLTNEEVHKSILRTVLVRQGVTDPDTFLESMNVESQVMYRDVRMPDGKTMMMASVVITKATPKTQVTDSQPQGE